MTTQIIRSSSTSVITTYMISKNIITDFVDSFESGNFELISDVLSALASILQAESLSTHSNSYKFFDEASGFEKIQDLISLEIDEISNQANEFYEFAKNEEDDLNT